MSVKDINIQGECSVKDEYLKPGEKIDLEINEGEKVGQYLSKVEDVINENTFVITRPISNEGYTYLSVGQVVRVMYYRMEALYYFDAEVIDRIKSNESVSAKLNIISDRYKLQRRNYYRLNIMVPVVLSASIASDKGIEKYTRKYDTVDISGGGLKIKCEIQLDINTEVDLSINIPGLEFEKIRGKVVRTQMIQKIPDIHEIAVEFTKISTNARQTIIKYIFAKQREIIKRGYK